MSIRTITPEELEALRADGREIALIDVRTPAEFREIHAAMARNVPLDRLDPQAVMKSRDGAAAPLYFICRAGSRGRQAAEKLLKAGYTDAINVEGGTLAWEAAGLAVVRGRKAMSLERQVRIAAGSLVLVGAVLGWLVSPVWIALSGFVGAGLVFAGITDTCGMAMLLSRMPWNQAGSEGGGCRGGEEP
jgi:rhodanese-related sulfurtransferase